MHLFVRECSYAQFERVMYVSMCVWKIDIDDHNGLEFLTPEHLDRPGMKLLITFNNNWVNLLNTILKISDFINHIYNDWVHSLCFSHVHYTLLLHITTLVMILFSQSWLYAAAVAQRIFLQLFAQNINSTTHLFPLLTQVFSNTYLFTLCIRCDYTNANNNNNSTDPSTDCDSHTARQHNSCR
jgi:predicted nucleic-acid-binding Zn-ribbon protein